MYGHPALNKNIPFSYSGSAGSLVLQLFMLLKVLVLTACKRCYDFIVNSSMFPSYFRRLEMSLLLLMIPN